MNFSRNWPRFCKRLRAPPLRQAAHSGGRILARTRAARLLLCVLFFAVNGTACPQRQFQTAGITIERASGAPAAMKVEIARSEEQRSRGLMYRKELKDGEGMLFVFERDQVLSFWMKNTRIPLSIAFIASDCRITEIKDMRPLDLNAVKSSRSVRYALEVPRGWFTRAEIGPGDTVHGDFLQSK